MRSTKFVSTRLKEELSKPYSPSAFELSKAIGIPPSTISRLCSGESMEPRFSTIIAIADHLGISIDSLCTEKNSKSLSITEKRRKDEELISAIKDKSKERIRTAIKKGATAHKDKHTPLDNFYLPPMCAAVKENFLPAIELIVSLGGDINHQSRRGESALHTASIHGNIKAIKILVSMGANTELCDSDGDTPLLWAIYSQKEQVVKELIKSGANPNHPGAYGITPLHRAADLSNLEMVKALIKAGANIRAKMCPEMSFMEPIDLVRPGACEELFNALKG